jgi:5'-deoxy-5'-methylthioadenosine phosphorylase
MAELAIIGGTGLTSISDLEITRREMITTPYGEPSGPLVHGELYGHEVMFLPRHGSAHTIPPHKVNYRANIWALKEAGARNVIAINAVGAIQADMHPASLVIPDQIIDYTWSRTNTFFEEGLSQVVHIDFTEPYCKEMRNKLIGAAKYIDLPVFDEATYAAMQGPRLESAAEINRLENDACHIVGMTGMPETALACELELCYACIAVVANMAAGRGEGEITMSEIERHLSTGMENVKKLIRQTVSMMD